MIDIEDVKKQLEGHNLKLIQKVTKIHPHTLRSILKGNKVREATLLRLKEYLDKN